MNFISIFLIFIGLGMLVLWSMLFLTKKIPELKTEPIRILFHIAAEIITAICLLIGGFLLVFGQNLGKEIVFFASGMLAYTCIVSPGYYAQQKKWEMVFMFAVILCMLLFSLVKIL